MTVEEAFAKLVGRQASEAEGARLYRLRDALGLRDSDAFWSIVMALEHYDAFFRQYPVRLVEQTGRCIGVQDVLAPFARQAASRCASCHKPLRS